MVDRNGHRGNGHAARGAHLVGIAQVDPAVHHRRLVGAAEHGHLCQERAVPGAPEPAELEGSRADVQGGKRAELRGPTRGHQHLVVLVRRSLGPVPDAIYEVAYGGLTDGEPMMFVWGQPERNTGEFHKICFGSLAARWNHRRVDSRTSRFTNKELIAEWERDYGEDSRLVPGARARASTHGRRAAMAVT